VNRERENMKNQAFRDFARYAKFKAALPPAQKRSAHSTTGWQLRQAGETDGYRPREVGFTYRSVRRSADGATTNRSEKRRALVLDLRFV
jgi:hypothetical protein